MPNNPYASSPSSHFRAVSVLTFSLFGLGLNEPYLHGNRKVLVSVVLHICMDDVLTSAHLWWSVVCRAWRHYLTKLNAISAFFFTPSFI